MAADDALPVLESRVAVLVDDHGADEAVEAAALRRFSALAP